MCQIIISLIKCLTVTFISQKLNYINIHIHNLTVQLLHGALSYFQRLAGKREALQESVFLYQGLPLYSCKWQRKDFLIANVFIK